MPFKTVPYVEAAGWPLGQGAQPTFLLFIYLFYFIATMKLSALFAVALMCAMAGVAEARPLHVVTLRFCKS
jgi:hypothetical protein